MTKTAELFKQAFELELSKSGKSLQDLEALLEKKAASLLIDPQHLLNMGSSSLAMLIGSAGIAGSALGSGVYGTMNASNKIDPKLDQKRKEKEQYENALVNLQLAQKANQAGI